ncbi:MAG: AbrB/MazE/SpoVT family DNA-binding domain-containing protein [Chloroflexota bacterium]|nr:AbrB/MazE/SpoVT family DNA-binding domain-containing protein [Chloroflexota bacterium]
MARTTTVSSKGWVVIPKKLREAYNLTPGAKVQIVDYGESLRIIPVPEDPIAALDGMFATETEEESWTEILLAERRKEYGHLEEKVSHE